MKILQIHHLSPITFRRACRSPCFQTLFTCSLFFFLQRIFRTSQRLAEAVIASRLSLGRFVWTSGWCEGGRLASLFIGMVGFFLVRHRAPLKLLGELTMSSMSTTILICHSLLIPLLVLLPVTNSLRLGYRPSLLAARFFVLPGG
ncbi:hypothetical protein EDB83DRAFT_2343382 [Lactarius deliciosus]|nr:hypothetical protein EDB83DRAFT_2343382 [Lactarius deliciosus]